MSFPGYLKTINFKLATNQQVHSCPCKIWHVFQYQNREEKYVEIMEIMEKTLLNIVKRQQILSLTFHSLLLIFS